jgi:hypothetical protein
VALFGTPGWVLPGASIDMNFATGQYFGLRPSGLTVTRAGTATSLLPSSASGAPYQSFAANAPRIVAGVGLIVEESRTNYLLNSTAPATQTTASLGTGTYTLWVNGAGSATMSSGTATGCGTGAASQGSSVNFTITIAGTCTVTVSGSLNAFQLEPDSNTAGFGTSLIVTVGSPVTRAQDVVTASVVFGQSYSFMVAATTESPTGQSGGRTVFEANDGTLNNRTNFTRQGGGNPAFGIVSGGTVQVGAAIGGASAWALNAPAKFAAALRVGRQRAAYNGALDTNTYAVTMPVSLNAIVLGSIGGGGNPFSGPIARVAVWPTTSMNDAMLKQVTH